ncbi:MAG TPA: Cache 3/Cache 2 fusion domain-containing protein [Dyella sp.]|uniref:Cache 3/Cache 2 fusion domain-containing protein n=1 Tax=Dyella sp. TaxID=1869338 RepID=UPI002F94804C
MFQRSLRVRLLLPVLALVLIAVAASAWILAASEATRIREEAGGAIDRQTNALQSLLAVTRSIMLDQVKSSMRLLRNESDRLGHPAAGPQVDVAGHAVNDLQFGAERQANHFDLVDDVTRIAGGTATIFSRSGNDDYIRIATNVKKDDGSRAVGTQLDPNGPVIVNIRKDTSFYGVVDILGSPYVTGYEPIFSANDSVIGIWYVGYKTDLDALDRVISQASVLNSGFIALFDGKGKLRFHSKTGITQSPETMEQVVTQNPADWVIRKQEVPGWGFTLVAAYPKSDVDSQIHRQSMWIVGIGLLICVLLLALQSALIWSRVLKPVQRLTAVADELSLGKWNHTLDEVNLKDEIGTLARAIARLSNSVRLAMERLSKR